MSYCQACGKPAAAEHERCTDLLAFDPPRFCSVCGFRLDVQVFPDGFRTSCRECRRRARPDPHTTTTTTITTRPRTNS